MRICLPAVTGICQESIMANQISWNAFRYEDKPAFCS